MICPVARLVIVIIIVIIINVIINVSIGIGSGSHDTLNLSGLLLLLPFPIN